MPSIATCPKCGFSGRLRDSSTNQLVGCRQCGTQFNPSQTSIQSASDTNGSRPTDPSVPMPAELGQFQLRKHLGSGAFGAVFQAYDPQLDRDVALKVPRAGLLDDRKRVERFLREAKAAASLRHPNIVPVYEAGQDGDQFFIASAYIDGRPLADVIDDHGLEFPRAVRIVRELAEALAYAHEQGVVHRDVKPANILLDAKDRPLLADFGLAARAGSAEKLTNEGAVLGTPAYMAPEQAKGQVGDSIPASDQYSLGVVLYELLTGRTPFAGRPEVVIFNQIQTQPDSPAKLRKDLPRDLETICLKAMAKQAADRYAMCQEMADDLRRWQDGEPIRARRLGLAERAVRWCRRNPALAGLMALTTTLFVAGTVTSSYFAIQATLHAKQAEANALVARQEEERANQKTTEAQRNAETALQEKQKADQKSSEAQASAQEAQFAKVRADQEKEKANQEAQRARDAKFTSDQYLYAARINLAQRAWDDSKIKRLSELLDGLQPNQPDERDLRGWDWHYLWRLPHGLLTVKGSNSVRNVTFSPDGRYLATSSSDRTVKVWDATNGREMLSLRGHTGGVDHVAYSPDGQRLASASVDKTIRLWDARQGNELLTLQGHKGAVFSVSFSPDGQRLASASEDGTVRVWDVVNGSQLAYFDGHTSSVDCVVFSPDGRRLASASADETVKILDASRGQELLTLKGHTSIVHSVAFSPDGRRIASASFDRNVKIWDASRGQEVLTLRGHQDYVNSVAFSPDGLRLASASRDNTIKVWDATRGQELLTYKGHATLAGVNSVAFSPDGRRLATAGNDKTVEVWDTTRAQGPVAPKASALGGVNGVAFSPDGRRVASANFDWTARVWDVATGQELRSFKGHTKSVRGVSFSPDRGRIASVSEDLTVKVWDTVSGQELNTFKGHTNIVNSVSFSPDGRHVASASNDKTVKVWDTTTGQEVLTLQSGTNAVHNVKFSPDGRRLAAVEKVVRVWDVATGRQLIQFRGLGATNSYFTCATFSPDGRHLASAGDDLTIRIWDATAGVEKLALRGHTDIVYGISFSPDGHRVASASKDKTIKVWDTNYGQELLTLRGHTNAFGHATAFHDVSFSLDGRYLAAAGTDGNVYVWDGTQLNEDHRDPTSPGGK